jgi:hypothetical protein
MPAVLLALAVLSTSTAQPAEPTGTLTLACQGTTGRSALSPDTEREPVSMAIILNFTAKTIEGFGDKYSIRLNDGSELAVAFFGPSAGEKFPNSNITGRINRVTGDVEAFMTSDFGFVHYSLKCKPTRRMF